MSTFTVPSHEIKTPRGGHVVVVKDFISGYDDDAIQAHYTNSDFDIEIPKNGANASNDEIMAGQKVKFSGSAIQNAERETVKRVVISVDGDNGDGKPNGVLDLVYNMHRDDTAFVKSECDKIAYPKDDAPAKKDNAANNTNGS